MPKEIMPQFILDVEKQELIIHAGLQDRVIQVSIILVELKLGCALSGGIP